MERSSKQTVNKETRVLDNTLNEMDLIDIFRTFHPNAKEYTLSSSAHGTLSRIDHIFSHKSNLSKFKKTEITSTIFCDHNTMRLDMNYKKKTVKNTNIWRLSNTFQNNQQVTKKSKGKLKNFWKQMTMNTYNSRPMWCSKRDSKREVYSNTILPQETRKILNRPPNFTPKTTGKRRTKQPKISIRKEIIKTQAEINKE